MRVVSQKDPAIDVGKSNLAEYRKTCDPAHLVFKDGARPIWYTIVDLEWSDYQECLAVIQLPGLAADRAFRYGVVGIEGVSIGGGDSQGRWCPVHERMRDGDAVKTISAGDMKPIFKAIAPRHILDIGHLLLERCEAERPGNGAGGAG